MKSIFIGPMGNGNTPSNGASVKNFHILKVLKSHTQNLISIDTENWNKRPFLLMKLFLIILTHPRSRYILSLNSRSAYKTIKILNYLAPKAKKIYWVIGGMFDKYIQNCVFRKEHYHKLDQIIVEGHSMKENLNSLGLENVNVLSNFKFKKDIPLYQRKFKTPLRFIFLSRIIPEKGCDLIIKAAENLYNNGYSGKFLIDFYGPIEQSYKDLFLKSIAKIEGLKYKGFLNLSDSANYTTLYKYDAMLFPTYWKGEGCPGVIIDAYFTGMPVLASDWNLNKDYVENNVTGLLFSTKSIIALEKSMAKCIDHPALLLDLSKNAAIKGHEFDIDNVLSYENLKQFKLLD